MATTLDQIARAVISLHDEGYSNDFDNYGIDQLWNIQENRVYTFADININKVCIVKARYEKNEKVILAIETFDGYKGLLIATPANCIVQTVR